MVRLGFLIYLFILVFGGVGLYSLMFKFVERGFFEGGLFRYRVVSLGIVYRDFWGYEFFVLGC